MDVQQLMKALAASTEPLPVPLGANTYRVKPPMDWPQSSLVALRTNDFNGWAAKAFVNDMATAEDGTSTGSNDGQTWADADLTFRQIKEFFDSYQDLAGQAPGESPASQS